MEMPLIMKTFRQIAKDLADLANPQRKRYVSGVVGGHGAQAAGEVPANVRDVAVVTCRGSAALRNGRVGIV